MEIRTDLRQLTDRIEQIVAHVAREVGDELDALDAWRFVDAFEQIGQPLMPAVATVELVTVDGLTEKGDFLATFAGQLTHLGGNVFRRTALFGAADLGHDAVRTELVAADHD